jgi:hypothetical protein
LRCCGACGRVRSNRRASLTFPTAPRTHLDWAIAGKAPRCCASKVQPNRSRRRSRRCVCSCATARWNASMTARRSLRRSAQAHHFSTTIAISGGSPCRRRAPPRASIARTHLFGSPIGPEDCCGSVLRHRRRLPLRAIAARVGGHATLFRASAESRATIPVFQPEPPAHAALTKSVKAAFDPLALFNPGRMFEDV